MDLLLIQMQSLVLMLMVLFLQIPHCNWMYKGTNSLVVDPVLPTPLLLNTQFHLPPGLWIRCRERFLIDHGHVLEPKTRIACMYLR